MHHSSYEFLKDFVAGGTAAVLSLLLTAPMERIKIILQVQKLMKQDCIGILGCAKHIYTTQGLLSFWRGNLANTIRVLPTSSISFALNEKFKTLLGDKTFSENPFLGRLSKNILCGAAAGVSCLGIIYPLDFTRTRLAADIEHHGDKKFNGIVHCFKSIYRLDGIRGIYRGFLVSAMGIVIYRGIYFGFYDTLSELPVVQHKLNIIGKFLIAQSVVSSAALVSYPFDTVRRIMMMQSGIEKDKWAYKNSFDCAQGLYKKYGLIGFYRGALSNTFIGVGSALILVFFNEIKAFL